MVFLTELIVFPDATAPFRGMVIWQGEQRYEIIEILGAIEGRGTIVRMYGPLAHDFMVVYPRETD